MRTVTFQSVLNGVAQLLGMVPTRDLNPARASSLTEYINQRVSEGWKWEFFPEWTVVEQRFYRATYDATANVVAGDERYHIASANYYQALRAQTPAAQAPATLTGGIYVENSAYWAVCAQVYEGNDWATGTAYTVGQKVRNPSDGIFYQCHTAHNSGANFDATKFGRLTAFNKYVAYEQTGLTPIDEVKGVYRRNPRVFTNNPGAIAFQPSNDGVQVDFRAPGTVFLEFRLRPPEFSATAWSATQAYVIGNRVYRNTTGESYLALQDGTGQDPATQAFYWQKINFPAVLASFVKRAALSDALKDQKQDDRSALELGQAMNELADATDRALDAQGQYPSATVVTYGR